MAEYKYTSSSGRLASLMSKIRQIGLPKKATTKWLQSVDFGSSNDSTFIPILKQINFIDESGVPTDNWKEYRSNNHNKVLGKCITDITGPPEVGAIPVTQDVIPKSIFIGTRSYIEKIGHQVNGTYENGCYDACAVMLRRFLETLIIEAFEKYDIAPKIKKQDGNFHYLKDLIKITLSESCWNMSRNTMNALPRLKDIGDKSAHSRRFNAHRQDIEKLLPDIRVCTQELIYLAGFQNGQ